MSLVYCIWLVRLSADASLMMFQGGLPSTKEMCLAFLMYYPRQEMSHCGSVPDYWYSRSGSFYEAFKSESTTGK